MYVYLPDGYNESTSYPVLYLLHGGSERYYTWVNNGNAKGILDNAISSGKAKPMIVVMPDCNDYAPELFTKELMNDIIPFTEASFQTINNKDNRALAGLSWGGLQVLDAGLYYYNQFGHLGVFSSGWFTSDTQKYSTMQTYLGQNGSNIAQSMRYFYLSDGGQWDISYHNGLATIKLLRDNGINVNYFQNSGGHTYQSWSPDLERFIPFLFQDIACTPTTIIPHIQINDGVWTSQNTASVCEGTTIKFGPHPYDISTGWSWTGPDNFTSNTREVELPDVTTMQNGEYTVDFKNAGGCTSSAKINLTIFPKPVITITSPVTNEIISSNSLSIEAELSGVSKGKVLFYNGNNLLGQDSIYPYNIVWSNPENGSYNLHAIASSSDNCSDTTSVEFTVNTITDMKDRSSQDLQILCTPNPSSYAFRIHSPGAFSYTIYDLLGVEQEKGEANQQAEVGIKLPSGNYFLYLQNNTGIKTIRITKE